MIAGGRWHRECGLTGRPCLVDLDAHGFHLQFDDLIDAAANLGTDEPPRAGKSGQVKSTLTVERLRRIGSPNSTDREALKTSALAGPADFLRINGAYQAARPSPFDYYVSWYDSSPTTQHLRTMRDKLDDGRLPFIPNTWTRGSSRWFFLGSVATDQELTGRPPHIDTMRHAAGTFHIQLHGSKRWTIRPPPACERLCGRRAVEVVVSAGQFFSLNTNLWQHETALLPALSATLPALPPSAASAAHPSIISDAQPSLVAGIARDYFAAADGKGGGGALGAGEPFSYGGAEVLPAWDEMDADGSGTADRHELLTGLMRSIDFEGLEVPWAVLDPAAPGSCLPLS